MGQSITLEANERKTLLNIYRQHLDPKIRQRAHILLLLDAGRPWALIAAMLFLSTRTIARWQKRFQADRLAGLGDQNPGRLPRFTAAWRSLVVHWVTEKTPRDFGFLRSRWSCKVLVILLAEVHHLTVRRETVRRGLERQHIVGRRPRPVIGPQDSEREPIVRGLKALLAQLPEDEVVVFQDEVDLNLNPEIGAMGMRRGQQAAVVTPGSNAQQYLAGSLDWRSGELITTVGEKRDSALFVRHLEQVRQRFAERSKIHVICDNAKFHDCKRVWAYLERWGHQVIVHFLPKYSPDLNPIERVWWHLREEVTRNHRCQTLPELIDLVFDWMEGRCPFQVEGSVYPKAQTG